MLRRLSLRNFVFVKQVEIEFKSGFCILTGETGVGKSLLIDALTLLSGARGSSDKVRQLATTAEIEANFSLKDNTAAQTWLDTQALLNEDDPATLLTRRIIGASGRKSSTFINDRQVSLTHLAEVMALLMDICGQHAHHSLRHHDTQQTLLDSYAGVDTSATATAHQVWQVADKKWQQATADSQENSRQQEQLQTSVAELSPLNFSNERWQTMNDCLTRTTHIADLAAGCAQTLVLIDNETDGAQRKLSEARQQLRMICRHDQTLDDTQKTLNDVTDLLNSIVQTITAYAEKLQIEPEQQRSAEHFVAECHRLSRKYGLSDVAQLGDFITDQQAQLAALPTPTDTEKLKAIATSAQQKLVEDCAILSKRRQQAADTFSQRVNQLLTQLAMPKARLSVVLSPLPVATASGAEKVSFQISTRSDTAAGSIADVASGGELSRLGLAVQIAAGQTKTTPIAVFDEVDAGIGGLVADVVGSLLRALGQSRQVLCVTHLPQVAAYADSHWLVSGDSLSVKALSFDERVEEIARMHSGSSITATARKHASEMLKHASGNNPSVTASNVQKG